MSRAVAERYAAALFELGEEKGVRDQVASGLATVREALAAKPDARAAFFDRRTYVDRKKQLLRDEIAVGVHPFVLNAISILVDRRRESCVLEFILAYFERVEEAMGVLEVEIESAQPLDEMTRARLESGISSATGRRARANVTHVPELLGGVRLVFGSRRLDGSLKRKIEDLAARLKAAV